MVTFWGPAAIFAANASSFPSPIRPHLRRLGVEGLHMGLGLLGFRLFLVFCFCSVKPLDRQVRDFS